MNKAEPKTTYLADYKPPPFLIEAVDLEFEIQEDHTLVTSSLEVTKNPQSDEKTGPFNLNGEELDLVEIKINEVTLENQHYALDEQGLTIHEVPEHFILWTKVKIKPSMNTKLEGLYASKTGLFTQCEAEGFRRIQTLQNIHVVGDGGAPATRLQPVVPARPGALGLGQQPCVGVQYHFVIPVGQCPEDRLF